MAVAVFNTDTVVGEAVAEALEGGGGERSGNLYGVRLKARFSVLPPGPHGFHIHRAGDLRGEGCAGACDHWHVGRAGARHGPAPAPRSGSGSDKDRHTGDLGNVVAGRSYTYELRGVRISDLWGRTLIVHADEDDLGHGPHEDSGTTGHSGLRIGCAVFGRVATCGSDSGRSSRRKRTQKRRN
jgi:Cu-Zn family superoxide dismutase